MSERGAALDDVPVATTPLRIPPPAALTPGRTRPDVSAKTDLSLILSASGLAVSLDRGPTAAALHAAFPAGLLTGQRTTHHR
jgi:hypothetical protein